MSYHRHRAVVRTGRMRGGMRAFGAIDDLGLGPKVSGDPVVALVAQLNRFAGKTVTVGGCKPRNYLASSLPLASALTDKAATTALVILYDRYNCVPLDVYSADRAKWASSGLGDAVAFVTKNLSEIVVTVAQFGDSLGYPPASVGITARDPRFTPQFPIGTVAIVGALALAAVVVAKRRK